MNEFINVNIDSGIEQTILSGYGLINIDAPSVFFANKKHKALFLSFVLPANITAQAEKVKKKLPLYGEIYFNGSQCVVAMIHGPFNNTYISNLLCEDACKHIINLRARVLS